MKRPGLIRALIFFYALYESINTVSLLNTYVIDNRIPIVHVYAPLNSAEIVAISDLVTHVHSKHSASVLDSLIQVNYQFPYLIDAKIVIKPDATIEYVFAAGMPICRINENYFLTDCGAVCLQHVYDVPPEATLMHIAVNESELQQETSMRDLARVIRNIGSNITEQYDLFWGSAYYIELRDKKLHNFKILCDSAHITHQEAFEYCSRIRQEFELSPQKKNIGLIADIRFAKQIVVYNQMGGK